MNEESACRNKVLFGLILGPFGVMAPPLFSGISSDLENGASIIEGLKVDGF